MLSTPRTHARRPTGHVPIPDASSFSVLFADPRPPSTTSSLPFSLPSTLPGGLAFDATRTLATTSERARFVAEELRRIERLKVHKAANNRPSQPQPMPLQPQQQKTPRKTSSKHMRADKENRVTMTPGRVRPKGKGGTAQAAELVFFDSKVTALVEAAVAGDVKKVRGLMLE